MKNICQACFLTHVHVINFVITAWCKWTWGWVTKVFLLVQRGGTEKVCVAESCQSSFSCSERWFFSVVLQWNPQNNLWATECLAWGGGFAGCHQALQTHESPPLCGHVYCLARWPRSSCHSLPFPQRRWSWEEEDRENKTHDLTKRRVFFNVRSCMHLQRWTQQSWTMKLKSSSVLSALNIYDAGTVPSIRTAKLASNDEKNSN